MREDVLLRLGRGNPIDVVAEQQSEPNRDKCSARFGSVESRRLAGLATAVLRVRDLENCRGRRAEPATISRLSCRVAVGGPILTGRRGAGAKECLREARLR